MNLLKLVLFAVLCMPLLASAQAVQRADQVDPEKLDFPTFDRVGFAMVCMDSNGGASVGTLTACTCRVDYIDSRMTFSEYEVASTNLRYAGMAGEKGALFRDVQSGKDLMQKLNKLREEAKEACPIARVSPDSRE